MTVQQIFDKVRFLTHLDTSDVTDSQLYRLLNDAVSEQIKFVAGLREDFLLKQGTSINLVADTDDYTLATDILQLKRVEVALNGTNYYVAYRKDLVEDIDLINETEVMASPKYIPITQTSSTEFIIRLQPGPTVNVTDGLRYWYILRPAALSSTAQVPVTPPELHEALVQLVVKQLKQRDSDARGMGLAEREVNKSYTRYASGFDKRTIDEQERFYAPVFEE